MGRVLVLLLGVVAYLLGLAVFAYFVGFVAGVGVPKAIDDGVVGPWWRAVLVDLALVAGFAAPHSVMARPGFKRALTAVVPAALERSLYVLVTALLLALLMWAWQPLPWRVWDLGGGAPFGLVRALEALGWLLVLAANLAIDQLHLFGLRQAVCHWLGRPAREPEFTVRGPYRLVRHPVMLGFLVAFWAAPAMSVGRLLLAAAMTAYVLVALEYEERDLRRRHGAEYRGYADHIPRLNPFARRR
jgi:protein-S-isoprenylcysteine O-methyltransferase Ste14